MATPPKGLWECPNCGGFVDDNRKICTDCGYDKGKVPVVSTRTFEAKKETGNERQISGIIERSAYAPEADADSGLVTFFKIVSVLIWIGGCVISVFLGRTEEISRYGGRTYDYNIPLIFSAFAVFFVSGGLFMAIGEIIRNLRIIASNTSKMKIVVKLPSQKE